MIAFERSTGIKGLGLDPKKRNSGGGATVVAAAQSGRVLSDADRTSIGQCLTGSRSYATSYATTDHHVLLRVTLPAEKISILVRSASTMDEYANMEAAVNDTECTAMEIIEPMYIEFLARNDQWVNIRIYNKLADAKPFVDDDDESAEWSDNDFN